MIEKCSKRVHVQTFRLGKNDFLPKLELPTAHDPPPPKGFNHHEIHSLTEGNIEINSM